MAVLSPSQRGSLEALADQLLPPGSGLPGALEAGVVAAFEARAASWHPPVRRGVKTLILLWDLGPLLSAHRARFHRLSSDRQREWVQDCYRSRRAMKRLQVAALKQLVFLVWASTPEVEDALGYDYRCRRDDEPHGAGREIPASGSATKLPAEPPDYHRPGPAIASGAIPLHLIDRHSFQPQTNQDRALTTVSWPDLQDGQRERADVVVVGSGAGGAVVAARLAELGLDVIVLEEGAQVSERDFTGPALGRFQRFCRDNGTTQVWGMPPIPLPLGKVVGGTTVVNSGTCFRAPRHVLQRWESEFGVEGANPDELADHYAEIESSLNVRPVPWALLGENGMAAHRGAVALGYSGGPLLRNIAECHGCGQCAFGCPTNAKQAMHITYLPRAQRAGARIFSRCRANRVVVEGERAVGVSAILLDEGDHARGALRVDAQHVVVCAGAIHTPGLLHSSGIADPSGQTGRNLRIHPATGVGGFFPDISEGWKGTLQSYYIDELFETHEIMFEATSTVPSIGAGSMPGIGQQAMDEMADFTHLATLGFYVSDTSKGRVRTLRNGDAWPTYRLNALDTKRLAVGLSVATEILLAAGASRVHVGLPGLDAISARADLEQMRERAVRPGHLRLTAFHPMGTVRMGADPARSVVDPFGRHHEIANLWVADASTFPSCVGVNPQMTIMALAKRTAETLAKS